MPRERRSETGNTWQLAEANNKFSEVFTRTIEEGPQRMTPSGEEIVLLSGDEYEDLVAATEKAKPTKNFIEHLLAIPKGTGLDLMRDTSAMRDIEW